MDNFEIVKKEFYMLARIPLEKRLTNRIDDDCLRKNSLFQVLAERVFDYSGILKLLKKRVSFWLSCDDSENTLVLAGYIYYLDRNFIKARSFFLRTVEKNPENLANWSDLAFSLYHCSLKSNRLAKAILFDFDLFIKFFRKFNYKICNINTLEKIRRYLVDKKLEYSCNYKQFIDNRDLRTISRKRLNLRKKEKVI